MKFAINRLVWLAQQQTFADEIYVPKKKKDLSPSSKLLSLFLFLDDHGIRRVGGRLDQSNLSYDQKPPMLLSHDHPLSNLIVRYEHLRHAYAGQRLIKSSIRQRFWIIRLDNL